MAQERWGDDAYSERWDILGGCVQAGEPLADAVLTLPREKSDVCALQPTKLHMFDDPERAECGWVMPVAHMDPRGCERSTAALAHRDDLLQVPIQRRTAQTSERRVWMAHGALHA